MSDVHYYKCFQLGENETVIRVEDYSKLQHQLHESKLAYEAAHSELVRANQDLARCRETCDGLRKKLINAYDNSMVICLDEWFVTRMKPTIGL